MKSENGFTLIEVLFVLAIWSILLLLSSPLNVSVLEKHTEKKFLETFQMDILYMQNLSYGSRDYYRLIFQDNKSYIIKKDHSSEFLVERSIPDGWQVTNWSLPIISFNKKGTITQPGNLKIKTANHLYKVICPLGKGRCYVNEQ